MGLAVPSAAPVAAAAMSDLADRLSWSLEEAREHADELGLKPVEADLVPSEDAVPAPAPEVEPMPEVSPVAVRSPAAGAAVLRVLATADARANRATEPTPDTKPVLDGKAGGLRIGLDPVATADGETTAAQVRVEHLDQEIAGELGAAGPVLALATQRTADSVTTGTAGADDAKLMRPATRAEGRPVRVSVDVTHLKGAGGDLIHRLGLEVLPACALTTPDKAECRTGKRVEDTDLDADSGVITGTVDIPAATEPAISGDADGAESEASSQAVGSGEVVVLAVTAGTAGSTGDWGATALSPSASWNVSTQTGAFSWSHPMRTPATAGGLSPKLSLSYSSGSLDGRVASSNNQSSQVGDGWEANLSGYVERKYVPCSEDRAAVDGQAPNNAGRETGDLCWKSDNATLVFNGSATDLVRDGNTNVWRAKNDDNMKVEHLVGTNASTPGWNSDNDKEFWKVTTAEGTQYWFGREARSATDATALKSSLVVPVYGNHPGEPCNQATFAASRCQQTWRWMLDHVVDTSDNSMTYVYARHTNRYGYNLNEGSAAYNRAVQLERIEYGTRAGSETTTPPARVNFTYAERCVPTADFTCAESDLNATNASRWPDVPRDLICTSTTSCPNVTAPAFFDRKRLTTVTTQVRVGGAYQDVDYWGLTQTLPNPGDGTDATVWLAGIKHTGRGGSAADAALPDVTFSGVQLDNRVDTTGDVGPAMTRWRIDEIRSESGGITNIAYSGAECTTANTATMNPQDNTKRCQPVYWTPEGAVEQVREYFHHYRVESVVENARLHGTAPVETDYVYAGGPAWHYDDNELVKPKHRTWGQLRGYGQVDVYTGATGDPAAPRLHTATRYFRGMHGDRSGPTGGTRDISIDGIADHDQFSGMAREQITYAGADVTERTLSTPWRSIATATDPADTSRKAYHTGTQESETITTLAAGGTRTTRTTTTEFDASGAPKVVYDAGNVAVAGDDRCTRTWYLHNASKNIVGTVSRVETVSAGCADTPARPGDVISDQQFLYDGQGAGVVPTRGRVTERQEVKSYSGTSPVYVSVEQTGYNTYGQVTSVKDALGNTTTTAYDTTTNPGLTSKTTATSPDPDGTGSLTAHVTTTDLNPVLGVPTLVTDPNGKVTTGTYDGLGRLTQVWEPGRVQGTDTPTAKFTYQVSATGANAVRSETLNWDGSAYVASSVIYDGLLRQRQAQTPSAAATGATSRVISESFYDSRGLPVVTRDGWATAGAAGLGLVTSTTVVDSRTETRFDGAGRPTSSTFQVGEGEGSDDGTNYLPKWTTTTTYGGDRVSVDPPAGAVPTTTVTDARGNTTELRQYIGSGPSGTHHVTSYTYDHADRLVGTSDPEGNTWAYKYDLRGRQTSVSDPDKGDTSTTYDDAGRVVTTTDARGEKLAYTYDNLGRKTSLRDDTVTGAVRARWTYDVLTGGTVVKGQPSTSVRVHEGEDYVTAVTGYDDRYRPTSQSVTLPASLGQGVAGTYSTGLVWTVDGQLRGTRMPAAGGLGAETVAQMFGANNVPDGMQGGVAGNYVVRADYLPTGELSYLHSGNTFAYQQENFFEVGTRRLQGVTLTQETANPDQLHELTHSAYSYDDAGNLLSIKDTPGLGGQPDDQQCFAFDWARRLTQAWTPGNGDCTAARSMSALGGADPYWKTYSHDLIGNRTSTVLHRAVGNGGDVTSTYTQPASGATSTRPHATTAVTATNSAGTQVGAASFTYDNSGNMTGRTHAGEPTQKLAWDAEGELAGVAEDQNGDGTVSDAEAASSDEYVYSADGERLVRIQDGTATAYLPGQEITRTSAGVVTGARYYTFAGQTVAVRTGNLGANVTSIFADHHGTGTIQIANVSNAVTRRFTDPFGAPRDSTAGAPDAGGSGPGWTGDRGFLDKTTDATGLTSVGARYYDQLLGAFISVDPVMDLSSPQQWNAYSYAGNNPVTWSDPTGLWFPECHDGSHSCSKDSDGNTRAKRNWDTCERGAISCVKRQGAAGSTVYVRECYTAYACQYYSTHSDGFASSSGNDVSLRDQTVSAAERAAQLQKARERAELKRAEEYRADQAQREQKNGWLEGFQEWADSDAGQTTSAVLSGVALGLGILAMATNPVGWAAIAIIGGGMLLGAASAGIDCANGMSGGCALGIAGIVTGGAGAGLKAARWAFRPIDRGVRSINRSLRGPNEAATDIVGSGVNSMSDVMGTHVDSIGLAYSGSQLAGWIKD